MLHNFNIDKVKLILNDGNDYNIFKRNSLEISIHVFLSVLSETEGNSWYLAIRFSLSSLLLPSQSSAS